MSIILDALKKAEDQDKNKVGEVPSGTAASEGAPPSGSAGKPPSLPPSAPAYSGSPKKNQDPAARKRVIVMAAALVVMLGVVLFKGKLTTLFQKDEPSTGQLQPVIDPSVPVVTAPATTPSQSATPLVTPSGTVPVTAVTGTTPTLGTVPTPGTNPLAMTADTAAAADPEVERLKQSAQENFAAADYEAAIADYRNLVIKDAQNPDPEVYNNYGVALRKAGLLGQAESAYGTALKLDPNYTQAMNNLAVVYMSQNQYVKAKDLLKKAIELDPEYIDAHLHLGLCLEKNGELEAAKGYYESFLKLSEFWKNYDKQDARKIRLLVEDRLAGLKEK